MEKFLFIIREDLSKLKQWNEEERYDAIREMDEWVKSLIKKGNYVGGDALRIKGGNVSKENVISGGRFIEGKEGISGFIFLEGTDLADGVASSQTGTPGQL